MPHDPQRCLIALEMAERAYRDALAAARQDAAAVFLTVREARGLSQAEMAERLGITQAYLSSIESGHHRPGPAPLVRLAGLLRTSGPAPALWEQHERKA